MPAVDLRILGDKELERAMNKLAAKTQKKVVRGALRKEATQTKKRVVANIGRLNLVDSGVMMGAFSKAKIRSAGKKTLIRIGVVAPERAALGIHASDKYYYPNAVEFGHDLAAPKPFQRPAIDEHRGAAIARIARNIGAGIKKEARK